MRPPTGYITLLFSIAKVVADAVVEFLANSACHKDMPMRLVAAEAADGGARMVESQASATGNGGV